MSEQTAAEYLNSLFPGWTTGPVAREAVKYYGTLRAEEERAKVLAELRSGEPQSVELKDAVSACVEAAKAELLVEWRATNVGVWLSGSDTEHGGTIRLDCVKCIDEALAMAQTQGAATKGHTTNCDIHQSRACDCGR